MITGSTPLLILWIVIAGLLLLTLAVAAYALLARLSGNRRARRRVRLEAGWLQGVLGLFTDPAAPGALPDPTTLHPQDRLHFLEFLLRHVRLLKGEERDRLEDGARPYLPGLAPLLRDRDPYQRARAAEILGQLGLPAFAPQLRAALEDTTELVAMVAARALAREGDVDSVHPVLASLARFENWSPQYLVALLVNFGAGAAPELLEVLLDRGRSPAVRAVAADALAELNRLEAVDPAARLLREEGSHEELASALLRLLARLGTPAQLEEVRRLATAPTPHVRALALRAVSALGDGSTELPLLQAALDDPSPWVALQAARGLRSAGVEGPLLELAGSGGPRARLAGEVLREER